MAKGQEKRRKAIRKKRLATRISPEETTPEEQRSLKKNTPKRPGRPKKQPATSKTTESENDKAK
jgi:hypothetical protein